MAHILFVVPRFHPNLTYAVRTLHGAGHRVSIWAIDAGGTEDHSDVTPRIWPERPEQGDVMAAFRALSPDLVILRHAEGLTRRVARAALGRRVVSYDLRPMTDRPALRKRLTKWAKGIPLDRVTPVRGLDRTAPTDPRATYLPWPTEAEGVPTVQSRTGPLRLICIGKLGLARKNQELLIRELEEAGLDRKVHLTLMGTVRAGAEALRDAGAARDWVTVAPPVPHEQMAAVFAAQDVCILPSVGEPLGVSPVEAMAYGVVPVISVEAGSAGYLTPGVDGLLCDPGVPGDLARAVAALLPHEVRAPMAEAARATAEGELGPEQFLERIDALL